MRPPSARRRLTLLAAPLVVALLTVAGCGEQPKATPTPEPSPTPIANLNTAALQVPRIDFCELVPDDAVRAAMDAGDAADATEDAAEDAAELTAYGNGDAEPLTGAGQEVLHEIGCVWQGSGDVTVRAWLFARPVDPALAKTFVASARGQKGCTTPSGPAFGSPSYTQECRGVGNKMRLRNAGLFGQSWLSCEITANTEVPLARLRDRTDAWCVEVANALNTAR